MCHRSRQSDDREEAANLANEVARVYRDHRSDSPTRVEIVDRAVPALKPSRPNRPLNLSIGMLPGLELGTAAGAAGIARRARQKPALAAEGARRV